MNDFKPFDDKLAGLIAALSPAARRRMAADIAKTRRARQQRRIKTQKARTEHLTLPESASR